MTGSVCGPKRNGRRPDKTILARPPPSPQSSWVAPEQRRPPISQGLQATAHKAANGDLNTLDLDFDLLHEVSFIAVGGRPPGSDRVAGGWRMSHGEGKGGIGLHILAPLVSSTT